MPPPIRHSMIVSERLPLSLVLAPRSLEPLGRWSVPSTSTVSVPVIMFGPELSAACAELGSEPLLIWALTRNRTKDSASHATIAITTHLSTRPGVIRRRGPVTLDAACPRRRVRGRRRPARVVLAAQA